MERPVPAGGADYSASTRYSRRHYGCATGYVVSQQRLMHRPVSKLFVCSFWLAYSKMHLENPFEYSFLYKVLDHLVALWVPTALSKDEVTSEEIPSCPALCGSTLGRHVGGIVFGISGPLLRANFAASGVVHQQRQAGLLAENGRHDAMSPTSAFERCIQEMSSVPTGFDV